MSLVITEEGDLALLDDLTSTFDGFIEIHLFKNNFTPDENTVLSDFIEADFGGYSYYVLSTWNNSIIRLGRAFATGPQGIWTVNAAPSNLVYGYYITTPGGGTLLWCERDPNAPVSMSIPGDTYTITPTLTLRPEGDFTPGILLQDDFTDANGVPLTGHIISPTNIPLTTWRADVGGFVIQSNLCQLNSTGTGLYGIATCDVAMSDGSLSVASLDTNVGILFRYQDASNYWCIWNNGGNTSLFKLVAGTVTAVGPISAISFPYKVSFVGDVITVTTGAGIITGVTDSFLRALRRIGVWGFTPTHNIGAIIFRGT